MIGKGIGVVSFDEFGNFKYQNWRIMSSFDWVMMNVFKEIIIMVDRINLF